MVNFHWKMKITQKIENQIQSLLKNSLIINRKYLDDEQLDRNEQFQVLNEIFDVDVRTREIKELSAHFAPLFRNDHPIHLSLVGKTGTGKTVSTLYFLNLLKNLCRKSEIQMKYIHLDLSTPRPCFRVLNDLACYLNASKRYKRGISLDELMGKIKDKIRDYDGYFVIFVDEIDHVRRDLDSLLKFMIKRLPQRITGKLVLVFSSNRLDWKDNIDPRIKSFLKIHELLFEPYNANDLNKILSIRIRKAINLEKIESGVVEKISAISCINHGDARKAVELLSKSAQLAEKEGVPISIDIVDRALDEIEKDKYMAMVKSSPRQLQAVIYSIYQSASRMPLRTGDAYGVYRSFCNSIKLRALTQRAFSDMISELDMYGFIQVTLRSRGRNGRTKEIRVHLPRELQEKIKQIVLMEFDMNSN